MVFNLIDSEYSFATGNLEEFVQERFAILDVLEDFKSFEEAGYFIDMITDDILLAYGLGVEHQVFRVPLKVYKRRLLTNKLFMDCIEEKENSKTFKDKNPFSMLSQETVERIALLMDEIKTGMQASLNGFYFDSLEQEELDGDFNEEDETDGVYVHSKPSCPRNHGDNTEENLAKYNTIQELIKKRESEIANASKKLNEVYKGPSLVLSRNTSRNPDSNNHPYFISYTAKILIRNESTHLEKGFLLSRLKAYRNEGMRNLEDLNSIQKQAIKGLQKHGLITQMPLNKLIDLVSIISRCQELEKRVVLECVKSDNSHKSTLHLEIKAADSDLHRCLNLNVYKQTVVKDQFDPNSAESFFNERIDKIKKTIYSNYYKARQIHRQVWQLKKKSSN